MPTGLTTQIPTLSLAGAKLALAAAEAEAEKQAFKVCIAVVDPAGHLLAFLRRDGASFSSIEAAAAKARTAASLGLPTKILEEMVNGPHPALLTFDFVCASQGGVPLIVKDAVVGAIGASGATGAEDESVAAAGAAALAAAAG